MKDGQLSSYLCRPPSFALRQCLAASTQHSHFLSHCPHALPCHPTPPSPPPLAPTPQQLTELYFHTSALLVLASTVVVSGRLPPKLNCVIQNLMAGLRREPVQELQSVAAEALAELMVGCAARQPCPNDKLVKNLCGMLCGDPSETPVAAAAEGVR